MPCSCSQCLNRGLHDITNIVLMSWKSFPDSLKARNAMRMMTIHQIQEHDSDVYQVSTKAIYVTHLLHACINQRIYVHISAKARSGHHDIILKWYNTINQFKE